MRAAVLALLLLIAGGVAVWWLVPGPTLLSVADGVAGGGRGVERVASAVPFGTTGQTLDIWRPTGPVRKRPVIVFFYGGGWVNGTARAYAFAARGLASAGFVVVMPDYRKVPAHHFPDFVQDGAAAVKWTRDNIARYGGDPARLAVSGHSAGAYIAAMLALDRRWLVAEGVDPAIVRAAVPMCGPYDFYPYTGRAVAAFAGVSDHQTTQPITFARRDAPPMLMLVAGDDTQVRPRNGINLDARLKALGTTVTLRTYSGLSHEAVAMALSKPFRGRAPVLADTTRFLHQHLEEDTQERRRR